MDVLAYVLPSPCFHNSSKAQNVTTHALLQRPSVRYTVDESCQLMRRSDARIRFSSKRNTECVATSWRLCCVADDVTRGALFEGIGSGSPFVVHIQRRRLKGLSKVTVVGDDDVERPRSSYRQASSRSRRGRRRASSTGVAQGHEATEVGGPRDGPEPRAQAAEVNGKARREEKEMADGAPPLAWRERSGNGAAHAQKEVEDEDGLWRDIRNEAKRESGNEPALASFLFATILAHNSLERALAFHVANKLGDATLLSTQLFTVFAQIFETDESIQKAIRADIRAFMERDPACQGYVHGMLYFKGFLACQIHRAANWLWRQGRRSLALALQNRVSEVFQVDIHPGACLGRGLLFDHATGVVVGETAVIGNNCSILHHVTLGGTGSVAGDRHPKLRDGVLIGANATLLGPIVVGEGAQIGAASLVLVDVPPGCTAVGVPARIIQPKVKGGAKPRPLPGKSMDHCSTIIEDYVI
eukprot:TRINITY_DN16580_c0_g1_i1.p1 TRINITY_DN16580_c0_g1~~TRINITY_DN16580_c0_g1_i1.p1  ORF type:complete len:471 (+),score=50.17 TRINITY_DN16580_c0_g1_i1:386-1798(+)